VLPQPGQRWAESGTGERGWGWKDACPGLASFQRCSAGKPPEEGVRAAHPHSVVGHEKVQATKKASIMELDRIAPSERSHKLNSTNSKSKSSNLRNIAQG